MILIQIILDFDRDDTEEMKKDAIESQLEKSEERLQNLIVFSRELINNIRDYNERQELIQSTSKYQMKEGNILIFQINSIQ